jgi:hypothetical protein
MEAAMAGRLTGMFACALGIVLAFTSGAIAQSADAGSTPDQDQGRAVRIERRVMDPGGAGAVWTGGAPLPMDFEVVAGPMELGASVVKGAPYAADAVTEVVQVLADGNRIVRSTTVSVYRDGAGRTRREQTLPVIGALVGRTEATREVVITDPDRGVTFVLNAAAKTARRLRMPMVSFAARPPVNGPAEPPAPGSGADVLFFETAVPVPGTPGAPVPPPALPPPPPGPDDVVFFEYTGATAAGAVMNVAAARTERSADRVETLGAQSIEGVQAEGTRSTRTIPAGQIGNERPIDVVSERWFSPELKALVLSRQTDPRFGETTYRLTNIVRAEPDASLFEVPSDYQIIDGGGARDMLFFRGAPPRQP